jgi:peptidoglycan/xylan/chitin deacetylase (PgdA/CDA1 family)
MKFIKKHYRLITFSDLSRYRNIEDIPKNSLILTFDDGYEDNLTVALPILQKYNIPCTIFLTTDMLAGDKIPWWDEIFGRLQELCRISNKYDLPQLDESVADILSIFKKTPSLVFSRINNWNIKQKRSLILGLRNVTSLDHRSLIASNKFLSWDQVADMSKLVDFASHSCSHPSLASLASDRIETEIVLSKREIEKKIGKNILSFSYPSGLYTEHIKILVKNAGYQFAVTQDSGINDCKNPYSLKRINIWEGSASSANRDFVAPLLAFKLTSA